MFFFVSGGYDDGKMGIRFIGPGKTSPGYKTILWPADTVKYNKRSINKQK